MAEIQGSYDDLFTAVPSALAALLAAGDLGASVAVFVDGEPVVDVWGGFADADRTIPWQRDTIANVWSVTKTMTALSALILTDRGELDLTAPVARYWPQFAAAGKDGVLVRHLLAHTAGLPNWDGPTTAEDLYDWPAVTARLATQAPQWEPGTAAGYHSVTQGFFVGEVVRRITGRSVGEFFADDVAGPLGADFHIGCPPSTTTGSRSLSLRRRRTRTTSPAPPAQLPPPPTEPGYGFVTGTASPGAARRSRRRAGSGMPARSLSCSR